MRRERQASRLLRALGWNVWVLIHCRGLLVTLLFLGVVLEIDNWMQLTLGGYL